ncbi:hypothetical protein [Acetobacter pasteurianus]
MSRIFRTLPCFGVMVGGLTLICAPALAASPPRLLHANLNQWA